MKLVALYLRVLTLDQHPETQLYDFRGLAAQHGLEIIEQYTDRMSRARAKRPGTDLRSFKCQFRNHGSTGYAKAGRPIHSCPRVVGETKD